MGGALSIAASAVCSVDATVAYYGIWPHSGERAITNPILVHVAEHEEHNWAALPATFRSGWKG
jgi:dienelactone hydrolase